MNIPREGRPGARALRAVLFVLSISSSSAFAAGPPGRATLTPRAIAWAQELSTLVARSGAALTSAQAALARSVGVRHPELIRIVAVDRIPLPREAEVKAAAMRIGLAKPSYEARGGIAGFLAQHLQDLAKFGYDDSPFEVDARAHEVGGPL